MKCQCPLAGYCETHQRKMTATTHRLCQSSDGYFDAFQADLNRGRNRSTETGKPKPTPCSGCQGRKKALNNIVPGLGDAVEAVATATGLKEWWEGRQVT